MPSATTRGDRRRLRARTAPAGWSACGFGRRRSGAVRDEVAAADEREREQAADERDDRRDQEDVVERAP